MKNLSTLPDDLPVPVDDGACGHLLGSRIPSVSLTATSGDTANLGTLDGTLIDSTVATAAQNAAYLPLERTTALRLRPLG